ncbi:All-trans-phytoene synthase/15-cis-phytoene synthase [Tsuneonella dongtanensis]|uniref:All-trans-phytoene synthase/15-cis-phytoene synthase n=1 Tax=Tsuneonella dongtanensis TaxID=692370 RepID=A0A1B2AGK0_9SPHN|nr:phytoene/squalene synthase family protein [Tsuneonella dongtanensis]ANY21277.1 All-trans-phytoene synthase/15-cis-phytoene synthase [Tsuneonella dongtanensis]
MRRPRRIVPRMLAPSRILRATPAQAGGGREWDDLVDYAEKSIARGSKSFSLASRLFDRDTREKVWLLYAWCRRCDDLADNQDHGGTLGEQEGAERRLTAIRLLTERALDGLPTADPAFDAFGLVARECGLTREMAEDVIMGFELDAKDWRPRSEADLARYCYHVAGAVGVMMAVVMGVDRTDSWMLDRACDLGLAFQLANIARDVAEDDKADRRYLPLEWMVEEDIEPGMIMHPHHRQELADIVARLIRRMERHEAWARLGAAQLPFRSRWAVLAAARIYGAIGRRVAELGPHAWDNRVVIGRTEKLRHVSAAFWEAVRNKPEEPGEAPQWSRGQILIDVRMSQPIPAPNMEPLPDGD